MHITKLLLTLQLAFLSLAQAPDPPIPHCDMYRRAVACHRFSDQDQAKMRTEDDKAKMLAEDLATTKQLAKEAGVADSQLHECLCQSDVAHCHQRTFLYFDTLPFMHNTKFYDLCNTRRGHTFSLCLKHEPCEGDKTKNRANIVCHDTQYSSPSMRETDHYATSVFAQRVGLDVSQWCSCESFNEPERFYGRSFLYFNVINAQYSPQESLEQFRRECLALDGREVSSCYENGPGLKRPPDESEPGPSSSNKGKRRKLCPVRQSKS